MGFSGMSSGELPSLGSLVGEQGMAVDQNTAVTSLTHIQQATVKVENPYIYEKPLPQKKVKKSYTIYYKVRWNDIILLLILLITY